MNNFKPSQVVLSTPPLTACFKKTEAECAAALLVWAMKKLDDKWQAVTPQQLAAVMTNEDLLEEPLRSWDRNPFFKPDFYRLVTDGFVVEGPDKALSFTELGLTTLYNSHWVQR